MRGNTDIVRLPKYIELLELLVRTIMKFFESKSINELILREKRNFARNLLTEAWEEGMEAGIEVDILAREMMHVLIDEISDSISPQSAIDLTNAMSKMAQEGQFLAPEQLQ